MIDAVSVTGGHLGASLGVVELTVALHYIFNTPNDKLIWDVGHQCYPHKILTGRKDRIRTLRQGNGLSGFTKRSESEYDPFGAAHSSTSISSTLGMAVAKKLSNNYTNGIFCNNAEMGKDPAPGLKKSCFCREHSDPDSASSLEPHIHISDFVKKYTIDPSQHVSTKWSSISLVHAIKVLFRQCYNSGAMKCVLLSDADVPIKTFDYVYSYLTKHDKSHLDYALLPPTDRNEHYTQIMMFPQVLNCFPKRYGMVAQE